MKVTFPADYLPLNDFLPGIERRISPEGAVFALAESNDLFNVVFFFSGNLLNFNALESAYYGSHPVVSLPLTLIYVWMLFDTMTAGVPQPPNLRSRDIPKEDCFICM